MDTEKTRAEVLSGKCFLGIEFGSTRIKAVLTAEDLEPLAQGSFSWQDSLKDGVWTYDLKDAAAGLSECYLDLKKDLRGRGLPVPEKLAGIGVSAMMHGYIARDKEGKLLVPFRTWRNTITGQAAEKLTELFGFNIPQRWSIAHLCQAVLNKEEHIERLDSVTTLASYIHELLTGRKVIGADDASGMIPLAADRSGYDPVMAEKFEKLTGLDIFRLFPKVLPAGEEAGRLTEAGALMIDPEGELKSGIPLCPPEGDAGTGMVATASVRPRTGNVSAGTSIFSMIVLEEIPKKVHPEIDIVTTPSGEPVAMVHCNTCSSDINAWVGLFSQVLKAAGKEPDMGALYETLFKK
ncbi:MAG: ATPase, partial [Firmicutes bacterium]|nr:ATPase [Bacillota bacterium]